MATTTRIEFVSAGFAAILKEDGTRDALAGVAENVRSGVRACKTHQRALRGRGDGRWIEIVGCDPKTPEEAYESRREMEAAL